MRSELVPSLEEFLGAPDEVVRAVAPVTMIYAAGGTRRSAALAGIRLGEEAPLWIAPRILASASLCFRYGVRHLILPVGRPQIFAETGPYRRHFFRWLHTALANDAALQHYRVANWRVRLVVVGHVTESANTTAVLDRATVNSTGPRVWFLTTPDYEELWGLIFGLRARTRAEAVKKLFGEEIPPAKVLLSFGKPMVALDHLPPLLFDEVQCYWSQRPGYSVTDAELRAIFYDRAFVRATWRRDKTGRAEQALENRQIWEQAPMIGLGRKIGPFWYPVDSGFLLDAARCC
jgi:hypothetical protein